MCSITVSTNNWGEWSLQFNVHKNGFVVYFKQKVSTEFSETLVLDPSLYFLQLAPVPKCCHSSFVHQAPVLYGCSQTNEHAKQKIGTWLRVQQCHCNCCEYDPVPRLQSQTKQFSALYLLSVTTGKMVNERKLMQKCLASYFMLYVTTWKVELGQGQQCRLGYTYNFVFLLVTYFYKLNVVYRCIMQTTCRA